MIDKFTYVLKLFDLNKYESRTYAALVMHGPSTVKEIREFAKIPYNRGYDVLEGLQKRGFVKMQPGRPMIYSAVNPRKVLKRECEIRIKVVEDLLDEIGPIYDSVLKKKSPREFFWTIRGRRFVREKLVEMINGSKEEILILGVIPISSDGIYRALKESIIRGVAVKCCGEFDSNYKSLLEDLGAQARHFESDHSKYVLVDGRESIIAPTDPSKTHTALYLTSPECVRLYQSYFNHIWEDL